MEELWGELTDLDSLAEVRLIGKKLKKFQSLIPLFSGFKEEAIWAAIEAKRNRDGKQETPAEDLKLPEWQIFSNPKSAAENRDFKLRIVAPPSAFEGLFEDTVLVERIREVRALLGFTRIESNADFAEATSLKDGRLTPLRYESPTWLPASEVRGEGFFLRIKEEMLMAWEVQPKVQSLQKEFLESHKAWRKLRNIFLSIEISRHSSGAPSFSVTCLDAPNSSGLRLRGGKRSGASLLSRTGRGGRSHGQYSSLHGGAG